MLELFILLALVIFGLFASAAFLASGVRDFRAVKRDARPSDIREHNRHLWQQAFKTAKLATMTVVIAIVIAVPPSDERSFWTKWMLIGVTSLIVASVLHERRATKSVIALLLRERHEDARELAHVAENFCANQGCPLRDPGVMEVDTQGQDDGAGEDT